MSHHLDSVTARSDGRLNATDLYVFGSPGGGDTTVFVLDVCPDAGKSSPTTLHPSARYEIHIEPAGRYLPGTVDGAAADSPSLTLQVTAAVVIDGRQSVTVTAVHGDGRVGGVTDEVFAQGQDGEVLPGPAGGRAWVGLAADPFAADAAGYFAVIGDVHAGVAPDLSVLGRAGNFVAGRNVVAIVVEVPNDLLPAADLAVWATIVVADAGEEKQVSRWGLPNVNVHVARGDAELDEINAGHPSTDSAVWSARAAERITETVTVAGTTGDPRRHGRWLAARLFPQVLPFTVGTPAHYGLFTVNGRALHDDVIDVALSQYLATPVDDGIHPQAAGPAFPYLRPPSDNDLPPLVP